MDLAKNQVGPCFPTWLAHQLLSRPDRGPEPVSLGESPAQHRQRVDVLSVLAQREFPAFDGQLHILPAPVLHREKVVVFCLQRRSADTIVDRRDGFRLPLTEQRPGKQELGHRVRLHIFEPSTSHQDSGIPIVPVVRGQCGLKRIAHGTSTQQNHAQTGRSRTEDDRDQ